MAQIEGWLVLVLVVQVVSQVAQAEGCSLSNDAAASIAGLADGDVRCAIQTLQALFASSHTQVCQQPFSDVKWGMYLLAGCITLYVCLLAVIDRQGTLAPPCHLACGC